MIQTRFLLVLESAAAEIRFRGRAEHPFELRRQVAVVAESDPVGDFADGEVTRPEQFSRPEQPRAQKVSLGRKPRAPPEQPAEVTRAEAPFARQYRQRKFLVQVFGNEGLDACQRLPRQRRWAKFTVLGISVRA